MPDPQQAKFEAEVRVDLAVIERVVRQVLLDDTAQEARILELINRHSDAIARAVWPHIRDLIAQRGVTDNG